jgi:hypothetical protein
MKFLINPQLNKKLNKSNKLTIQIEQDLDITFKSISKKTPVNLVNSNSIIDSILMELQKLHFQAVFQRLLN